eukprot:365379-Chlamydomonas_euryale.AAC.4
MLNCWTSTLKKTAVCCGLTSSRKCLLQWILPHAAPAADDDDGCGSGGGGGAAAAAAAAAVADAEL